MYNIKKLRGENYYITCEITSEEGKAKLWKAKAHLNNFQGEYPSREEILQLRQPRIVPIGEDKEMLAKFLESKNLYEEYKDMLVKFLVSKNLYNEYIDCLLSANPRPAMNWQVTKKRVRQVLK